jgi:DNA-binding GntR family transcriptional regulator
MKHVCERISETDKRELKSLVQKMRTAARAKDHVAVSLASRKLREELWRISGHETANKMLVSLNAQLVRLWFKTSAMPGRAEAIVEELTAVVEAVCAASISSASKAMKRYHEAAIANLKRSFAVDSRATQ